MYANKGVKVYNAATIRHEDPRQGEAAVMIRLTRRLEEAEHSADLIAALDENRRFWAKLMAHVSDDANELPVVERARLISIGNWVGRFSSQVIAGKAERDPLIDINRTIIAGLRKQVNAPQQEAEIQDGTAYHGTA
jgi:flagellar protein FlaF